MSDDQQPQGQASPQPEAITGPPLKRTPDARFSDIHNGDRWDVARYHPQGTDDDPNAEQGDPFLWDIYFGASHVHQEDAAPVDEKELGFKNKVEQTLGVLKAIYRPKAWLEPTKKSYWARIMRWLQARILGSQPDHHDEFWKNECVIRFLEAYERLFSLTVLGLTAKNVDLRVADDALETLRNDTLMREGGRIKNRHMFKLGVPAFLAATFFVALFLLYDNSVSVVSPDPAATPSPEQEKVTVLFPVQAYEYREIFLLLAGCMIGTWLSFAARKVTLAFTDLAELEGDRLAPKMRLFFTGSLAVVLTLFFLTGVGEIRIGDTSSAEIMEKETVTLLAGFVFGMVEQRLPAAVMDRAAGLINGIKPKT